MKKITKQEIQNWLQFEKTKIAERQAMRELRSVDRGVARSVKQRERTALPDTSSGVKLRRTMELDFCNALAAHIEKNTYNTRPEWIPLVIDLDIPDLADLTLRLAMDGFKKGWSKTKLTQTLGEAIKAMSYEKAANANSATRKQVKKIAELGKRYTNDASVNYRDFNKYINRTWQKPTSKRPLEEMTDKEKETIAKIWQYRKRLQKMLKRNGFDAEDWTVVVCNRIAGEMLAVLQDTFKEIWKIDKRFPPKKKGKQSQKVDYLVLSKTAVEMLEKDDEYFDSLSPMFSPMIVEPISWATYDVAPYYSTAHSSLLPLVKNMKSQQRKEVEARLRDGRLRNVIKAVDAISRVPLVLNTYVYDALLWVEEQRFPHEHNPRKFPRIDYWNKVAIPEDIPGEEWAKMDWRQRNKHTTRRDKLVNKVNEIKGNVAQLKAVKRDVEELFADEQAFYLPHNLDSRGRVYHIPDFGHQNTDYIRALFLFANQHLVKTADKYGEEEANLQFLELQLANTYGAKGENGDLTHEQKQKWCADNEDMILRCGEDFVSSYDRWSKAKEPFQFLAACRELVLIKEAHERGEPFYSGLPIGQDCTQSGVQHFGAAMLDKDDGEKVNLRNLPDQQDLYRKCLDRALVLINEQLQLDEQDQLENPIMDDDDEDVVEAKTKRDDRIKHAHLWLNWRGVGLSRDDLKRNVMTAMYSSKKYGFADQIRDDIISEEDDLCYDDPTREHYFGDDEGWMASWYLAGINEKAIFDTITSADEGMVFFKDCADALSSVGKHLRFVTPLGFPMFQHYVNSEMKKQKLSAYSLKGKKIIRQSTFEYYVDGNTLKAGKSGRAISPNIIHAMDATFLMMTVLKCLDDGMEDIIVIHDSFSTTMGQSATLAKNLRVCFRDLYKDYNLFEDLLNQVKEQIEEARLEHEAKNDGTEWVDPVLPSLPNRGNLDLDEILQSEYFCC